MKTRYIIIIVGLMLIIALLLFEQIRIENKITEIEKNLKVLLKDSDFKMRLLAKGHLITGDIMKETDKEIKEREQDIINLIDIVNKKCDEKNELLIKHMNKQINNLQEEIEEVNNGLQNQINIIAKYLNIKP